MKNLVKKSFNKFIATKPRQNSSRFLPFTFCLLPLALLSACSKTDPILPGTRIPVFGDSEIVVQGKTIPDSVLSAAIASKTTAPDTTRVFTQDSDNVIWEVSPDGARRKVFSGFPTISHVETTRAPVCANGFVYAGLSTGEVVKIDSKTREMKWAADIFKGSAMTGGGGIMDIVAPIVLDGKYVYAGGLGGAFCKIKDATGAKVWCNWIGVAVPFSVYGELAFVIATDGNLYAINTNDGGIYWRAKTACTGAPTLSNDATIVQCSSKKKSERFSASDGKSL